MTASFNYYLQSQSTNHISLKTNRIRKQHPNPNWALINQLRIISSHHAYNTHTYTPLNKSDNMYK